jgi:hypothetical protein
MCGGCNLLLYLLAFRHLSFIQHGRHFKARIIFLMGVGHPTFRRFIPLLFLAPKDTLGSEGNQKYGQHGFHFLLHF